MVYRPCLSCKDRHGAPKDNLNSVVGCARYFGCLLLLKIKTGFLCFDDNIAPSGVS